MRPDEGAKIACTKATFLHALELVAVVMLFHAITSLSYA
jgi:hypothetical protein